MDKRKHLEFSEICVQNGWKCTSQRLAVYDYVHENNTHPCVDEVWDHIKKHLPTVTRESVYRILNEFAACGIIQRLDHIGRARYDSQTHPQGHFICVVCGHITDFAFPDEACLSEYAVCGEVRSIELRVSGICAECGQINFRARGG